MQNIMRRAKMVNMSDSFDEYSGDNDRMMYEEEMEEVNSGGEYSNNQRYYQEKSKRRNFSRYYTDDY